MADDDENVAGPSAGTSAPPRKPKSSKPSGFKWKQKSHDNDRNRDRDDDRDRRRDRDFNAPRRYDNTDRRRRSRSPRRDQDRSGRDRQDRRESSDSRPPRRDRDFDSSKRESKASGEGRREARVEKTAETDNSAKAPRPPAEPMIVVNVNDRMGSKTSVPCLASDTVGMFKMQVAAMIGRRPHEIRLQRQGQRPFKDHITLGDYEIHDGVQLDLEVDTGD